MRWVLLFSVLAAGCRDSRGDAIDAGRRADAGTVARDAGSDRDARSATGDAGRDGSSREPDAAIVVLEDAGTDAGTPALSDHHIHIQVDNFCNMTVTPTEITIPADQTAYFDWHNHSVDYPVDVWMSYGGGYLELETGATWDEPIGHCATPLAHDEYADISTACSEHRFLIHCL